MAGPLHDAVVGNTPPGSLMPGVQSGGQNGGSLLAGFGQNFSQNWPMILAAAGRGLGQISKGQPVDLSQDYDRLQQEQAKRKIQAMLQNPEIMAGMTPQQRAMLEALPPEAAAELAAGQVFGGPDQKRYNVGGALVDAQGNVVYQGSGDDSALSRKVSALMESGVDRNTALGIATGRYVTSRDPITGVAQIVDKASGRVLGSPSEQMAQAGAATDRPRGEPLYEQADEATGLRRSVETLSTDTLGQLPGVGGLFSFPDTVEAQQNFSVATNDLIRSLSINPRFPVGEMNRIRSEIAIEPSAFKSPEGMRARMRSVDNYLRGRLQLEQEAAQDSALPPDQRKAAIQAARNIENFLNNLGVPQGGAQDFDPATYETLPVVSDRAAYDAIPSGALYRGSDGAVRRKR